jgi:hypothetical protein
MMVQLSLEMEVGEVVAVDDLNNNSLDHQPFFVSAHPASKPDLAMENDMDMDNLLNFELSEEEEEEVTVMAKEVEIEVVREKKKRQERGRAVLRKKKREQQEEQKEDVEEVQIQDTVTVSCSEWEEMKKTMKDAVDHLAVCERAL